MRVYSGILQTRGKNRKEDVGCDRAMPHSRISNSRSPEPQIQPALGHEEGKLSTEYELKFQSEEVSLNNRNETVFIN